jgi:probable phosphoglycerate mutase
MTPFPCHAAAHRLRVRWNNTGVVPRIPLIPSPPAADAKPELRLAGVGGALCEVPADRPPCRLVVVRHGATAWSTAGRHTGRTDVPLEPHGEVQARALAGRLGSHQFSRVLVSPLGRARRTCELAGFRDRAEVWPDLAEWDYGGYEGLTSAEIRRDRPGWRLWVDGVPGGERLEDVAARADRVVDAVRAGRGDVLAFAHGHVLRVVAARWMGMAPAAAGHLLLAPAALGVLTWEHGLPALGRWDDDGADPLITG